MLFLESFVNLYKIIRIYKPENSYSEGQDRVDFRDGPVSTVNSDKTTPFLSHLPSRHHIQGAVRVSESPLLVAHS
jgi:hypothetical protein